jgi:hypothetical protein
VAAALVESRDTDWAARSKHETLLGREQRIAKHFLLVYPSFELRCLHCELDAALRIDIQEIARGSCELARACSLRLGTRVAAFDERKDGDRRHEDEPNEGHSCHAKRATAPTLRVVK